MTLKRNIVALLAFCCLWSFSASAAPKQLTDKELAALAEKVDQADKLFKDGKFEEALPLYQDAYQASEEPTMLFSMAQCYRNLHRFQEAADSYEKFLQAAPKSEYKSVAEQGLQEAKAELAKQTPPPPTKPEVPPTPSNKRHTFLVAAGASGAAGAGAGIGALLLARAASDAVGEDATLAEQRKLQSTILAATADVLFVSAIGLGVIGFLAPKDQSGEPTVLLGPTSITLSVRF